VRCESRAEKAGLWCSFLGKAELQSGALATIAYKKIVWMEGDITNLDRMPRFDVRHTEQLVRISVHVQVGTTQLSH
jgi:hypothetical protein